ncbi:hypothetical protein SLEP1_g597 [Rubroshorea leprosula]|uniref:Uncharacterized protein n=1 Tax=Rubroshorea leprosula TaxID=152421 RepID=A0AAV5HJT4_9ROSI|nr:hypothetical protein SLEP1_g597 [Rubroshorea leprosula]
MELDESKMLDDWKDQLRKQLRKELRKIYRRLPKKADSLLNESVEFQSRAVVRELATCLRDWKILMHRMKFLVKEQEKNKKIFWSNRLCFKMKPNLRNLYIPWTLLQRPWKYMFIKNDIDLKEIQIKIYKNAVHKMTSVLLKLMKFASRFEFLHVESYEEYVAVRVMKKLYGFNEGRLRFISDFRVEDGVDGFRVVPESDATFTASHTGRPFL